MIWPENSSSAAARSEYAEMNGTAASIAATSAPGMARDDVDEPDVVDVLVGHDHQLEVLDRPAVRGQRALQLVERAARVRPGVDERQRLVLDQVAVDAPDRERGRDREPVDAGLRGGREQILGHARISSSTSSRFSTMWSGETSDSRFSRSSGSVLEGRTLKCHSGWSTDTPSSQLISASA